MDTEITVSDGEEFIGRGIVKDGGFPDIFLTIKHEGVTGEVDPETGVISLHMGQLEAWSIIEVLKQIYRTVIAA